MQWTVFRCLYLATNRPDSLGGGPARMPVFRPRENRPRAEQLIKYQASAFWPNRFLGDKCST